MSSKEQSQPKYISQAEEAARYLKTLPALMSLPDKREKLIKFLMKRGWSRAAAGHRAGEWGLKVAHPGSKRR